MLDWFRNKGDNKVVPFPTQYKETPYIKPPEPEKPPTTYYRLGLTSNNRVSFQLGYSEITMNAKGVDDLIEQLELFKKHIVERDVEEETDNADSTS